MCSQACQHLVGSQKDDVRKGKNPRIENLPIIIHSYPFPSTVTSPKKYGRIHPNPSDSYILYILIIYPFYRHYTYQYLHFFPSLMLSLNRFVLQERTQVKLYSYKLLIGNMWTNTFCLAELDQTARERGGERERERASERASERARERGREREGERE